MSAKFNPSTTTGFHSVNYSTNAGKLGVQSALSSATPPPVAASPGSDLSKNVTRKNGSSTATVATPRSSQSQRSQHKNSWKSGHKSKPNVNVNEGFPDAEDALSEQYPYTPLRNRRNQTSLSHLLNFTLPPRDEGSHRRNNAPSWQRSSLHTADKAHFVNANFRFVVDPNGDYRVQAFEPDAVIPWYLILQILVSKHTQASSCPICLTNDPVASRMARCGHIFCLPCLMRLLESDMMTTTEGEGKPKKKRNSCPLCLEKLSLSDAKPVKWTEYPGDDSSVPQSGKDVVLRLVMRKSGSILALPRDGGEPPATTQEIPWYFAAEVANYARVMKGTEEYMTKEFEREILELEFMEQEDGAVFGEDGEWTHKAIEKIFDSMESMRGMEKAPKRPNDKKVDRSRNLENIRTDKNLDRTLTTGSRGSASTGRSQSRSRSEARSSSDIIYYFYQPRDASNTFLSALDIRILKTAFGSFAAFPSTVLVRVEKVIGDQVVDEDLRKRLKYLAYLPAGCPISILECDWTDVIKPEVLELFAEDLENRKKQRSDKEFKEERARQKAMKEEENSYKNSRRSGGGHNIFVDPGLPENAQLGEGYTQGLPLEDASVWPSLTTSGHSTSTTPSTSPAARTTVWGTPVISFPSTEEAFDDDFEDDAEKDRWAGWDDSKLFEQEQQSEDPLSGANSKKKKKKKKLVLMSTGGGWHS
ncbi:hypothetical protein V1512DRAFT_253262 [Lipomyces arxii]|uniref:uncharacterized protein n=1 Tax=Lipomyces arxii TaxID=56418 RepID=UPI0034CF9397